jgi:hypothetical protein
MAFKFPKSIDQIEESTLLEPGFYKMRLVKEPVIADNKKKKDGLSPADGAGENLVLKLRIISEDPTENGRAFTKWLPMPIEGIDEEATDAFTGQRNIDKKMEAIVNWVLAFGGTVEEDEFDLRAGSEAYVMVSQEEDFREPGKMVNSLDMNALPKPVE